MHWYDDEPNYEDMTKSQLIKRIKKHFHDQKVNYGITGDYIYVPKKQFDEDKLNINFITYEKVGDEFVKVKSMRKSTRKSVKKSTKKSTRKSVKKTTKKPTKKPTKKRVGRPAKKSQK